MSTLTIQEASAPSVGAAITRFGGRLMTAAEAVAVVEPGHRVMVPIGSQPLALADALAVRLATFGDTGAEMADCAVAGNYPWLMPGYPGVTSVVHEHWGGPAVRAFQRSGAHDYLPIPFSLRFKAINEPFRTTGEVRPVDVALVQVSLPDEHGYVYFGPNAWNQQGFCNTARFAIGEMSSHVPRAFGRGHTVHVSKFHALVLNESGRRISTVIEPTEIHRRIAANLAELVRDGDTLQLGAGSVPSAVAYAGAFDHAKDLGWHSEATIGRIIDLIEQGVINSERKTLDPGIAIATGYSGNPEQMDFVRLNPRIETRPTDYVHNVRTIAAQDNMLAINAAAMVDLSGQICADSIGHELIGGSGGQLEFAIGAVNAKNGRSVTLVQATAPDGENPRIVTTLPGGTIVTVPRLFADTVVTEFGIARLWGKTVRERARELAAITHPDHRADLLREAETHFG